MNILRLLILFLLCTMFARGQEIGKQAQCCERMENLAAALKAYALAHSGHYPESLEEWPGLSLPEQARCPQSLRQYRYAVSADLKNYGLCCEGSYHENPNYPAASSSCGLGLKSSGRLFSQCSENIQALSQACEAYRARCGTYPSSLALLLEDSSVQLVSCKKAFTEGAPRDTDYALMLLAPDSFHILCTSVNHVGEGYAPLQPSYINGLPAEALFLLEAPESQ